MNFTFTGTLLFNSEDSRVPWKRKIGDNGIGINATVKASDNNRAFIEVAGWQNDTIRSKDTDNNDIQIAWEDRNDKEVIDKVARYRKHVITFSDKTREEFITEYDLCDYMSRNLDKFKDKRFTVTGQVKKSFYKGKQQIRYTIGNLYEVSEDDERKNNLEIRAIVCWSKDGIDTSDFKEDKKIYLNGYTSEWVNKDAGVKYISQQLVLDCSKIDFENEKHLALLKFRLGQMGIEYKDGKFVNKLKAKNYYTNEVTIALVNGAQDVGGEDDFTYDMLTDLQKEKVDLGLAKVEDFKPKDGSRVFGDWVTEYRIKDFPINGKFEDGLITMDETADEFEEEIYTPPVDENMDDVMNPPTEEKKTVDDDDDDDIDDLFG